MEYEMYINNTCIKNKSINSINYFLPRNYYKDKIKLLSEINTNLNITTKLQELSKRTTDNNFRILIEEDEQNKVLIYPFIFKYKLKNIKKIHTYNPLHIRSSIIKTIVLDGDGSIRIRIKRGVFVLYNYWLSVYLKNGYELNIKKISHNVIIDIEKIISIIINKSLTTYKQYNITGNIVSELRTALIDEKILNSME